MCCCKILCIQHRQQKYKSLRSVRGCFLSDRVHNETIMNDMKLYSVINKMKVVWAFTKNCLAKKKKVYK